MPLNGFYYTYGDDNDMIEQRWLPDVQKRYPKAEWIRLDATIDDIDVGRLVTEYQSNDLFSKGKVIVIRNADSKLDLVHDLSEALAEFPIKGNALVLLAKSWNKTTKLGKLAKKHFVTKEFAKPEVKPFDLLDCLNTRSGAKVLFQANRLFEADYHPLALFSLIFGHFMLLRQIQAHRGETADTIARELKQHVFRIKKGMIANRYWSAEQLDDALHQLGRLDSQLRTWQHDEKILVQMALINLCL